jgi:hypothetical protein
MWHPFDMIELFGAAAASAMVVCYALEERGPGFTLAFAASCAAAAGYALAIGSWPFFVVEGIWAGIAVRRAARRFAAFR